MSWKLYEHLGIARGASKDEIKKAYKKKALETHPDRGGDPEVFKQVNNAYSILNDDNAKSKYDQLGDQQFEAMGGASGGTGGQGGMNMDPNEIFRQFFGGGMPGGGAFNFHFQGAGGEHQEQANIKKGNHKHLYKINMNDSYTGIKRTLRILLHKTCLQCCERCYACQGRGQITEMNRMGFFTQMMTRNCGHCNGSGNVTKAKSGCAECKGEGKYTSEHHIQLELPAGIDTGHKVVFEGMGEQPTKHGDRPGDLHLEIFVQPHERFTRQGNDLYIRVPISFKHSIIGTNIEIPHFTGKIDINTCDLGIIQPSKQYVMNDRGMPLLGKKTYGNMILQFDIQYPSIKITPDHAKKLEEVFVEIGV